mgnify:CR=1 FL=1
MTMTMKTLKAGLLALTLFGGATVLAACEEEGPAEKAGEKIDNAGEEMGEAIEEFGDSVEDAADDAK